MSILSTDERRLAPVFYQALLAGQQAVETGVTDPESVQAMMQNVLAGQPAIRIEYLPSATLTRWSRSTGSTGRR